MGDRERADELAEEWIRLTPISFLQHPEIARFFHFKREQRKQKKKGKKKPLLFLSSSLSLSLSLTHSPLFL